MRPIMQITVVLGLAVLLDQVSAFHLTQGLLCTSTGVTHLSTSADRTLSHPTAAPACLLPSMQMGGPGALAPLVKLRKFSSTLASASDFILDTFDPEEEEDELSNENMLKIIYGETFDQDVNEMVWRCLGYKLNEDGEWANDDVFPKWRDKHPTPPDLIGIKRNYTYEIDRPVQKANQDLVKSVPMKYKQGVKEHLRPLGFMGFKLDELTPNKTRRAQCVNWLLFYREALRGKTLEQLKAEAKQEIENQQPPPVVGPDSNQRRDGKGKFVEQSDWKYPNKPLT